MKKRKFYLLLYVVLTLVCSACEGWLTVEAETAITGEKLYTTNEGVKEGLNGLYLNMRGLQCPGRPRLADASVLESMACTHTFCRVPGYRWADITIMIYPVIQI